ncbi:disintegrin and metalloproteinase domain-containing protein 10-like isoform X2 [Ornithodoros turicata]|uniref:disintegrin and metalloproteinase domain-containing protein 10-like isoform X2 n=1 Tax=Ornithodoros turicata TaxID=34597 RepID=UPI003139E3B6
MGAIKEDKEKVSSISRDLHLGTYSTSTTENKTTTTTKTRATLLDRCKGVDMRISAFLMTIRLLGLFPFSYGRRLNAFVKHFEPISYGYPGAPGSHVRLKREASASKEVHLKLHAHSRDFHLRLRPDTSVFHKDFVVETASEGVVKVGTGHIYSGEVVGEPESHVYGSLHNGVFEGSISTRKENFYVEAASKYFKKPVPFKSIIYSSDQVEFPQSKKPGHGSWCGLSGDTEKWMNRILENSQSKHVKGHRIHRTHERIGRRLHGEYLEDDSDDVDDDNDANVVYAPRKPLTNDKALMDNRTRRKSDASRRVCNLQVSIDHHLFEYVSQVVENALHVRQRLTALVAAHAAKLNEVFGSTNFDGIEDISFIVQRIKINDSTSCLGSKSKNNPFCSIAVDSAHMLHLASLGNYDDFCLSYIWTYRDFADGVLGLAWIAKPEFGSGGLCEKNRASVDIEPGTGTYQDYALSLNVGIVTFLNYNSFVPQIISELSMCHEVGHSFGAPHDDGPACVPGGFNGNYLMYSSATTGLLKNNAIFSPCSVRNISRILQTLFDGKSDRENCLLRNMEPICGNAIQEGEEQCDCGMGESDCLDKCCYARHNDHNATGCTLRPRAECSPSSGSCCGIHCNILPTGTACRRPTMCSGRAFCDGESARCPFAPWKPDMTPCNNDTQVCRRGTCTGSICEKFGLVECSLSGRALTAEEQCVLACRDPGTSGRPCLPVCHFSGMEEHCGKKLQPGSPCNGLRGYCDVFQKCRPIDAEGPLFRMEQFFFGGEAVYSLINFIKEHVVLSGFIVLGSIWCVVLVLKLVAVHTPSHNPKRRSAYSLKDTIRHPFQYLE